MCKGSLGGVGEGRCPRQSLAKPQLTGGIPRVNALMAQKYYELRARLKEWASKENSTGNNRRTCDGNSVVQCIHFCWFTPQDTISLVSIAVVQRTGINGNGWYE